MNDYRTAVRAADAALELDPAHEKSRHRLTKARQGLAGEEAVRVRAWIKSSSVSEDMKERVGQREYYRSRVFPNDLPIAQVYQRLIDAYRIGLQEEYCSVGLPFDSEEAPIHHFTRWIERGRSTRDDGMFDETGSEQDAEQDEDNTTSGVSALPSSWNDTDDERVRYMALHDKIFGLGSVFSYDDELHDTIEQRYAHVKTTGYAGNEVCFSMILRAFAGEIYFYEGSDSDAFS